MRFYLTYGLQHNNRNRVIILRPSGSREATNSFAEAFYYPESPPFNKVKELRVKRFL